jgi:hypothetical protein
MARTVAFWAENQVNSLAVTSSFLWQKHRWRGYCLAYGGAPAEMEHLQLKE